LRAAEPTTKHSAVPPSSPEAELLLACARVSTDDATAAEINETLKRGIDWERSTKLAQRHGMLPLLYWNLRTVSSADIPAEALSNLRSYFQENVRRNLFLTRELLSLLNLLESNGIPAVPYKGPVLAQMAYQNLAFREMCDLDIFIRQEDFPKAIRALHSQGYRSATQLFSERAIRACLAREYAHTMVHDKGSIVELHWAITPKFLPFSLDNALWERLEPLAIAGTTVLNFVKEDLLLILCVHGAKHMWERLEWICCLAQLIRNYPEIDWTLAIERAEAQGGARLLLLGLLLAHELFEVRLAEEVRQRIQADPTLTRLGAQVRERLFRDEDGPEEFFEESMFHFSIRERTIDRLRYSLHFVLRRLAPNVEDRAFLPLPRSLFFLYYAIRPLRLFRIYLLKSRPREVRDSTPPAGVCRKSAVGTKC
jgi:Uncharacterised nucleotidyltransferase